MALTGTPLDALVLAQDALRAHHLGQLDKLSFDVGAAADSDASAVAGVVVAAVAAVYRAEALPRAVGCDWWQLKSAQDGTVAGHTLADTKDRVSRCLLA
jgi:hypothetical protein